MFLLIMDIRLNFWFMLTAFSLTSSLQSFGHARPQVSCYFIFGDSLVDNGNNLNQYTQAQVNYFPYGIDYPSGHTGRSTNGRTFVDFIAEFLGFEDDIPPNAFTSGRAILTGLNYASGAGGIRSETGKTAGFRLSFDGQLQNHERTVSSISNLLGENAMSYMNKCLYTIGMGSNDYINNYLVPDIYETSKIYNPTNFATVLIQQYSQQLKTLYNLGARKIAILGLGPIGCIPFETAKLGSNICESNANNDAQLFDSMLPTLVDSLNRDHPDARFIFVNVTHLALTLSPDSGITIFNTPCCVVQITGLCTPGTIPCRDRNAYAFFDAFHPTENSNQLEAERAYNALTPLDNYPYDINTLINIQL